MDVWWPARRSGGWRRFLSGPSCSKAHPRPTRCLRFLRRGPGLRTTRGHFDGYLSAVEERPVSGGVGAGTVWFRQQVALVAGEETSPLSRTLVVADSGSGISVALNPAEYLFMNVDLSVALLRDPTGEWICLSARTTIGTDGTGLVNTELVDSDGAIGRAMQTRLVAAQPGSPTGSQ